MTTTSRLAALTTDRFVATDNGNFWFVADTHATDANGTARVKDEAQAKRWAKAVVDAEVEWDSPYLRSAGVSRDGEYKLTKVDGACWEITRPASPNATSVIAKDEWTAALYIRERKAYWINQTVNLGVGSRFTHPDPSDGVLRTEVVVEFIGWADNSDEIRGHLGGRRQLTAPHGDACF